ncbi:MAG: hypothetical protein A2268_01960 [Candidatus Raymondbacteria bacterium RifOxyA12_full_50_37]|uniref:Nitroreductase domain-containing protein n=1 Tax=Candidatus Raymondbacteria bacterium RIFOXYD12_FULL_49_13 TaxID=1817890 RepID=A0A1F7F615_UNCRA|nr:MAG: hypothetical protein A2268_01960 [Candidatus Raymondbacteria bacterium RifOxyA12_full_50_37]OGJ92108.1 MAG: hypothetical protein A2248_10790 [Candidatus Raymondbacteria bacterium RIFOXYA2_FULL_49_16]OGJ98464.1 MAG: hypothetical protein A2453_07030 [Candidatus Raymondbacteria bacterium RIFOXYC2_FULL_50_21]OGK00251.1 MAG: hypothetical protein A2350_05150 [Candidatus Raymondbacteria bacterium RifOxyB12_full_50_8]OGK02018.1 MAG: hypothetical protein A2519_17555 [Candidatus Raymondbacteria b
MNLDAIIQARYSCRSYNSGPVRPGDIRAICEAARLAPSACNSQTWRYVVVANRDTIHRISDEGSRAVVRNPWMRDASVVIAGCAKLDLLANGVGTLVTGTDYHQIDFGISMEHMVLKATELGLGTCWIGWFDEKSVKKILNIPRNVKVLCLLTVGYPKERIIREKNRKALEEIVFWDSWGNNKQT